MRTVSTEVRIHFLYKRGLYALGRYYSEGGGLLRINFLRHIPLNTKIDSADLVPYFFLVIFRQNTCWKDKVENRKLKL